MESGKTYAIKKTGEGVYALFSSETKLAELSLRNKHGSSAEIRSGNEILEVRRDAIWKKDLYLGGPEKLLGRFSSNILSRGDLELRNHKYRWRPRNISWTEWAWETPHGFPIMTIRALPTPGPRGLVKTLEADGAGTPVMALLGWYLLLLNQQGFDAHVRHAAEHILNRPSASVK